MRGAGRRPARRSSERPRARARAGGAKLAALAVLSGALALGGSADAWDPLKAAGQSLVAGATAELQPVLASTVADVDKRTTALATKVLGDANKVIAESLDHTNNILEKQILHVEVAAKGVVADALASVDDISRKRVFEVGSLATNAIKQIDKTVAKNLDTVNGILRDRTRDLSLVVGQALDHADQVLSDRIQQIDEVAGRRLANVDVIVTKQRAGIEETLVRVAVLVGLLVFVVFVVIRLWREYQLLSPKLRDKHGLAYALDLAGNLGQPLLRQIFAAGLAALLFVVLYSRLPLGAHDETNALIARHAGQLTESLNQLEYAEVRFHASQLEMLLPPDGQRYRAMAAKADLLQQFLGRPTLLSTPQGIRTAVDKASEVERLFGTAEVDPDVLVLKAAILWQVGTTRKDEHEAASLCARAVRIGRGGFALQPIAVDLLRSYLGAPYVPAGTPFGRDAEAVPELEIALGLAGEPRQGFPLGRIGQLHDLIRNLDRASSRAYVQMAEAHADVVRLRLNPARPRNEPGAPHTLDEAKTLRLQRAKEVVAAWKSFDADVQAVPGLQGSPEILFLFRLNDAVWTRAFWFVQNPGATDAAPLLSEIPENAANLKLRIMLAPPRIAWARRYAALLDGPARTLVELQEANRYRTFERIDRTFEKALVETFTGPDAAAASGTLTLPASRKEAALAAAQLGLFVDNDTGRRLPYALALLRRSAPRPPAGDGAEVAGEVADGGDRDVTAALAARTLWAP